MMRCKNEKVQYCLRGIVYFSNAHFTARIMTTVGDVLYHDGIVTGRDTPYETKLADITESDLSKCKTAIATLSIYARE